MFAGALLTASGLALAFLGGIHYTCYEVSSERRSQLMSRRRRLLIPPLVSGLALVGGLGVVIAVRK
jgi:hypothetical protein